MTDKIATMEQPNVKQDVVSMTIFIPTALHKLMKIDAIRNNAGLYDHVIAELWNVFKGRG